MILRLAGLIFVLGSVPFARGQAGLSMELVLESDSYLPGEEISVGVRLTNLSGQPVTFGVISNWLTFFVERRGGEPVERLGEVPVAGRFTIESAKIGTKRWNISPYFDVEQPGSYSVSAQVRIPQWDVRLESQPESFVVMAGRKLCEIEFGVPPRGAATGAGPDVRKYALQQANRRNELRLFARVTDESESRIYGLVSLDRLLSFSQPDYQLDANGRFHVLFQTGARTYTYCVIDPDARLAVRQKHELLPGERPRLARSEGGAIAVRGGRRVPHSEDIPPLDAAAAARPAPASATGPGR